MKYLSNCGGQMVEAVQFTSRESIDEIVKMGVDVEPALFGIIVSDQFVIPGHYVISTPTTIIKDSKTFNRRFKPVIVQDELF